MNIETNPVLLTDLVKNSLKPWYENRWLDRFEQSNIDESLDKMYGIIGQVLAHLSIQSKNPKSVVATLEGSMAEIASNQLIPYVQAKVRKDLIQNTNIIGSKDPTTIALVDFLPDEHTLDSDIVLQQFDVNAAWEIINIKHLIFSSGEVKHLALPKHYKIYIKKEVLDNGCELLVLKLKHKNKVIHHIDFSRNPSNPSLQNRDKRTDRSGNSLHDIIKHPLTATENGAMLVDENRRAKHLANPEKARKVSKRKSVEAATEIAIRDMRKSVTAIRSRNYPTTPIAELSNKEKFISKNLLKKIKKITPEYFEKLDEYFKISWLKEAMIISTLDPYLALWWLNVTGLDESILGVHFDDLEKATKELSQFISKSDDVEKNRDQYYILKRGDGFNILTQLARSSLPPQSPTQRGPQKLEIQ